MILGIQHQGQVCLRKRQQQGVITGAWCRDFGAATGGGHSLILNHETPKIVTQAKCHSAMSLYYNLWAGVVLPEALRGISRSVWRRGHSLIPSLRITKKE